MNRTNLLLSGGLGLLAAFLVALAAQSIRHTWLPTLFDQTVVAWLIFIVFFLLTLIETPITLFGLRKIAAAVAGSTTVARWIAVGGNGVFVFFPAVYALPGLLLTGEQFSWLGWAIVALSLLRLIVGLVYLDRSQPST